MSEPVPVSSYPLISLFGTEDHVVVLKDGVSGARAKRSTLFEGLSSVGGGTNIFVGTLPQLTALTGTFVEGQGASVLTGTALEKGRYSRTGSTWTRVGDLPEEIAVDAADRAEIAEASAVSAVTEAFSDIAYKITDVAPKTFTVNNAVTSPTPLDRVSQVFTGWGVAGPKPASFTTANAVRIRIVNQTPLATAKIAKIGFVFRTHATAPQNAGVTQLVVAWAFVQEGQKNYIDTVMVLRDPATPANLKSLTLADMLARYAYMVYAWDKAGNRININESRGISSGITDDAKFYVTTANPESGLWTSSAGGGTGLGVEFLSIASPVQDDEYSVPNPAFAEEIQKFLELTPSSIPSPNYENVGRLRTFRANSYRRMLPTPEAVRIVMGIGGDSWSTTPVYMTQDLIASLKAKLGDGGIGFHGFGFAGTMGAPTFTGSSGGQYNTSLSGTGWTSNYHAGSTSPNISDARTSTPGDKITMSSISGASHPALSDVKLHFTGTADGVIRYRWTINGVVQAWSANINVQGGAGVQQTISVPPVGGFPLAALAGAVLGFYTLEIEDVSGSIILCGPDLQSSTANGIVIHKLGSSGSKTSDWTTSMASGEWAAGYAALGCDTHVHTLGVNDQAALVPVSTYSANVATIMQKLKTAIPSVGILACVPPETPAGYSILMSDYARVGRIAARVEKVAFLDMQIAFGDAANPSEYATGGIVEMYRADNAHPTERGAAALDRELENTLFSR